MGAGWERSDMTCLGGDSCSLAFKPARQYFQYVTMSRVALPGPYVTHVPVAASYKLWPLCRALRVGTPKRN